MKMKGGINYRKESVVYERLFKGEWFKTQTCLPKKQPVDCNNFWLQSASAIHAGIASLLLFLRQILSSILFSSGQLNIKLTQANTIRKDKVQEAKQLLTSGQDLISVAD